MLGNEHNITSAPLPPHDDPIPSSMRGIGVSGDLVTVHENRAHMVLGGIGNMSVRLLGRGNNLGSEVSYDHPTLNFIAAHADDYIRYYGRDNVTTDEQIAAANSVLGAISEPAIWLAVGFSQVQLRPSEKQGSFLKENNPELAQSSQHNFRVVHDEDGREWLLKRAERTRDTHKKTVDVQKLEFAQALADEEAMAYNIANYLGYPVPETTLVSYEGKPWVAYRYINHAQDSRIVEDVGRSLTESVANPAAVTLRPVFNFLVGSFGDGAHQGIVDPVTGKYYAQDLGVSSYIPQSSADPSRRIKNWDEFLDELPENMTLRIMNHGDIPKELDTDTFATLTDMVDKLRGLNIKAAATVLRPRTPMYKQKLPEFAEALTERAAAFVRLYDSGYFLAV